MISKSYINNTLKKLDTLYSNSRNLRETEFYAKLAIVELCGWVEVSFDDILIWYINKKISKRDIKFCKDEIIKMNNGFHYKKNIRPMFSRIIGLKKLEIIENKINKNGDMDQLKTILGNLKVNRDKAAHNYIKNITRSFDAPSRLYQEFMTLFRIMERIESEIRLLN